MRYSPAAQPVQIAPAVRSLWPFEWMRPIDSAETIPPSECGLGQVSAPSVCEAAALIDAINELHSRLYTAQVCWVKARLYTAQALGAAQCRYGTVRYGG